LSSSPLAAESSASAAWFELDWAAEARAPQRALRVSELAVVVRVRVRIRVSNTNPNPNPNPNPNQVMASEATSERTLAIRRTWAAPLLKAGTAGAAAGGGVNSGPWLLFMSDREQASTVRVRVRARVRVRVRVS